MWREGDDLHVITRDNAHCVFKEVESIGHNEDYVLVLVTNAKISDQHD